MTIQKWTTFFFAAAGMLSLILDSRTAMEGAAAGLELCIKAVIPSLFPFLFFSSLLTDALWGCRLSWMQRLCKRLGIPAGAEVLLIPGFLGGYPAGAQAITNAYRDGRLNRDTAQRLLFFCCNAGPAFLFGIVAPRFSDRRTAWMIWVVHILSALLTGLFLSGNTEEKTQLPEKSMTISDHLLGAVRVMGIICGWAVLFRIILAFLNRWFFWILPQDLQPLFWGMLELSNGCCILNQISSEELRFIVCCMILSFGGLCVVMQTASVIHGLSLKPYLLGKMVQTLFSLLLSLLFLRFGWVSMALCVVLFFLFPKHQKKRGSILSSFGV